MNEIFESKGGLGKMIQSTEFDVMLNHVRARHINKCDAFLKSRLHSDLKTSASTFLGSQQEICMFLKDILYVQSRKIQEWAASGKKHCMFKTKMPAHIGAKKFVRLDDGIIREEVCTEILFVFKRTECRHAEQGIRITLTAYPQ